jgi:hypothetical protein
MAALLANPDPASICQNLAAETGMLFTVLAKDRHIGNVDGRFALHNSSLDIFLWVWPCMPLDQLNALNHDSLLIRNDDEHAPGLAAILATKDINVIVLLDWVNGRH